MTSQSRYCEELALLYVHQEQYDRARHYVTQAVQQFMQDWSGLDALMTHSRAARLQSLHKLTELREFIEFMSESSAGAGGGGGGVTRAAGQLTRRWAVRSPDAVTDSCHTWDDVVTNRSSAAVFVKCLCVKMKFVLCNIFRFTHIQGIY